MVLHVVIGSGAAGSMAALTLLQAGHDVLLIERGPFSSWERKSTLHGDPISWGDAAFSADSTYVQQHDTKAQPQLSQRLVTYPQGRGLGGTLNVNAMIWSAGHRAVFDRLWPEGWCSDTMGRCSRPIYVSYALT